MVSIARTHHVSPRVSWTLRVIGGRPGGAALGTGQVCSLGARGAYGSSSLAPVCVGWAGRVCLWASREFRVVGPHPAQARRRARAGNAGAGGAHCTSGAAAQVSAAPRWNLDFQSAPSTSACIRDLRAALTNRWRSWRDTSSLALRVRRRLHETFLPRRSSLVPVAVWSVSHASAHVHVRRPGRLDCGSADTARGRTVGRCA